MRSIVTVTQAATEEKLCTVERVKDELGVTGTASDELIETLIEGASARIAAELGFRIPFETVRETFRPDGAYECAKALTLDRTPVGSVSSVVVDGTTLDSAEYEFVAGAGLLYRLATDGSPRRWEFCRSVVVTYGAGYVLPDETDSGLDPAIEKAACDLTKALWFAKSRDPLVKAVDIPGLMSQQYWVGQVGEAGSLPPDVLAMLMPFKRVRL